MLQMRLKSITETKYVPVAFNAIGNVQNSPDSQAPSMPLKVHVTIGLTICKSATLTASSYSLHCFYLSDS